MTSYEFPEDWTDLEKLYAQRALTWPIEKIREAIRLAGGSEGSIHQLALRVNDGLRRAGSFDA